MFALFAGVPAMAADTSMMHGQEQQMADDCDERHGCHVPDLASCLEHCLQALTDRRLGAAPPVRRLRDLRTSWIRLAAGAASYRPDIPAPENEDDECASTDVLEAHLCAQKKE